MLTQVTLLGARHVFEIDGVEVGTFVALPTQSNDLELWSFEIYPEFRGCGYSGRLLNEVIRMGKNEYPPRGRVLLWVLKDNERAIHLYTKHGFLRAGENEDSIFMELPL